MNKRKQNNKAFGLIGLGFLAGTLGVKALTSKTAKDLYVRGIAQGMRLKDEADLLVERAKESVDDIVAEADAINTAKSAQKVIEPKA